MDDSAKRKKAVYVLVGLLGVLGAVSVLAARSVKENPSEAAPVVVKPANPSDPKYQPNPALGLAGGAN
jgi:hypothetical protein